MINIKKFIVGPIETNCYIVYDDKTKVGFLIDPGFFDKNIQSFIDDNGIHIKNIINTHGHADHISGNSKFGYPILIHKDDESFLKNPIKNLSLFTGGVSLSPKAERLLSDGDIIEEGDIRIEVLHTPGHTPGGICLKMGNVLFSGDTLFMEGVGRTDFMYGDQKKILTSIKEKLLTLNDDIKVLPGHGDETTIGHERKNNPFI
jgi:hydroxyacylglutathione hydrolase